MIYHVPQAYCAETKRKPGSRSGTLEQIGLKLSSADSSQPLRYISISRNTEAGDDVLAPRTPESLHMKRTILPALSLLLFSAVSALPTLAALVKYKDWEKLPESVYLATDGERKE